VKPARRTLAEAVARSEARHVAVHKNRNVVEEVRELYRRSGGQTPRLGFDELASHYERQLEEQGVNSVEEFRQARLQVKVNDFVSPKIRDQLNALRSVVMVRGREVEIEYDVEEQPAPAATDVSAAPAYIGVARLRLPEKVARTMTIDDLPELDRPVRFVVTRGQRGAVRAATLEELQELLEGPWTPNAAGDAGPDSEPGTIGQGDAQRPATLGRPRGSGGPGRGSAPRKFGRVGGPKRNGRRGGGGKRR
jgi:hypothetical protein